MINCGEDEVQNADMYLQPYYTAFGCVKVPSADDNMYL